MKREREEEGAEDQQAANGGAAAADAAADAAGAAANAAGDPSPAKRHKASNDAPATAAAKDDADGDVGDASDGDGDERIALPVSTTRSAVKRGHECPYLDTVNRAALDFDFEKCCSVSLSPLNVYACLVCGRYFQGRGLSTHAFTHALDAGHHLFMKLAGGRVYVLPDNYEVADRSLDDVRAVLDPRFTPQQVTCVCDCVWSVCVYGVCGAVWTGQRGAVHTKHAQTNGRTPLAKTNLTTNTTPHHTTPHHTTPHHTTPQTQTQHRTRSRASTPTSRGRARSTAPSTCPASSASTTCAPTTTPTSSCRRSRACRPCATFSCAPRRTPAASRRSCSASAS